MSEINGLGKLRLGFALLIVAELLIGLVFLITIEALLPFLPPSEVLIHGSLYPPINAQELARQVIKSGEASSFLSAVFFAVFLAFIAFIIFIIAIIEAIRGFDTLNNYVKGSHLGIYGIIVLFISAIVNVIARNSTSSIQVFQPTQIIGDAIGIIGNILIGIALYNIGRFYDQSLLRIGAILIIIPFGLMGGLIPLLISPIPLFTALYSSLSFTLIPFILPLILCYLGLNNMYIRLGKVKPIGIIPTTQPQSQIYQIGQGIIRGNGYAQVSLYSTTQATVLSARIEGTNLTSLNVNPTVLQVGQNEVTIKFDNVSSLTPGGSYIITIVVNIGGNLSEIKANVVYQP